MNRSKSLSLSLLASFAFMMVQGAQAQTYLDSTGAPTFTTAFPVENGFINLSNGNLHIEIPLASYAGRGRLGYSARMVYDSRIWTPAVVGSTWRWVPTNVPGGLGGWRFTDSRNGGGPEAYTAFWHNYCYDQETETYETYSLYGFIFTSPDGARHNFDIPTTYGTSCDNAVATGAAYADDGSGYYMEVIDTTTVSGVWAPDGTRLYPQITDVNGNFFDTDSNGDAIDTRGRKPVVKTIDSGDSSKTYYDYLTIGDSSSARARITVKTKSISPVTSMGQSGISEHTSGSITVLDYIEFADGTRYTFGYDSTGELNSITLPTGGVINYTYDEATDVNGNKNLWVTQRVRDIGTWTFTTGTCSSTCPTMVVQAPDGAETGYTFNYAQDAPWNTLVDAHTGTFGSSTLLFNKTITYDYSSPAVAATSELTTVGGIVKKVTYAYDGAEVRNLTSVSEWDWISNSGEFSTTPMRQTLTSYVTGSGYLAKHIANLPSSVLIKYNGATVARTDYTYDGITITAAPDASNHDYTDFGTGNTIRGNVTNVTRCVTMNGDNCGTSISNSAASTYDELGNLLSVTDPGGHATSFAYATAHENAYLTQVTLPTTSGYAHVTQTAYDPNTGLVRATCGENFSGTCASNSSGADVTLYSYDSSLRPYTITRADGGVTAYTYTDEVNIKVETKQTTTIWTDSRTRFDAYGRVSQQTTANAEAGSGWDLVTQCYDSMGRIEKKTYPVQSSSTFASSACATAGDTYTYDKLSRVTEIAHATSPATSALHTYEVSTDSGYLGLRTIVTDESSKSRRFLTDGLGRQIRVAEVVGSTPTWTTYTYNGLDQLTYVDHGDRDRTFTYDALGRLLTTVTPESGTTSFTYNSDGTVYTRVRPKANQTSTSLTTTATYAYDALHRILGTTYTNSDSTSNTTAVPAFAYDEPSITVPSSLTLDRTRGRLSRAGVTFSSPSVTTYNIFSYDLAGRVASNWQTTPTGYPSTPKLRSYTYDLLGNVLTEADGVFSKTYTHAYNVAGRQVTMSSSANDATRPGTLLSDVVYNAYGQPTSYFSGKSNIGGYNFSGVKTTATYNDLGQLTAKTAIDGGGTGNTRYSLSGATYHGNGNLNQVTDNGTWTHSYDDLNRLTTSAKTGTTYSMTYDDYGNILTGATVDPLQYASTNRISASAADITYDALGSITSEKVGATPDNYVYIYDSENRLVEFKKNSNLIATYLYDAFGRRLKKDVETGTDREYFYDLAGRMVVETSGTGGVWGLEYYAGGLHLGTYTSGHTYFSHQDYLGTERIKTDETGAVAQDCTYRPFGSNESCTGGINSMIKYAGYERDPATTESGLDHMWFRYYNPRLGRFMTTDPYGASLDISDPQSSNRYAYVGGNPVGRTDPSGLDWFDDWLNPALQNPGLGFGNWIIARSTRDFFGSAYYDLPGMADPIAEGESQYLAGVEYVRRYVAACNSIAGTGGTIRVTGNGPEQRFQFNGAGFLVGASISLTGPNDSFASSTVRISPNTLAGYQRVGGGVSFGVSNPVLLIGATWRDRNAYFSSATFTNGSYTEVRGAVAIGAVPIGSTTGLSGPILRHFNSDQDLLRFGRVMDAITGIAQDTVTCKGMI